MERVNRSGPITILGDKGYAGADFETEAAALGATVVRPRRKDETEGGLHLAPLRQRIESIYWSAKDILGLKRHGARTLRGLRARIASRPLALAAAISLNYELGRNSLGVGGLRGLSRGTTHLGYKSVRRAPHRLAAQVGEVGGVARRPLRQSHGLRSLGSKLSGRE